MKVLIIVPAYNEELNIEKTVNKIISYGSKSKNEIDYIVVNDGSRDKTEEILKSESFNKVNLIQNLGIGGAVQTGYKYAYYNDYDVAIQFDGDGQHNENYIDDIVEEIENGYDFVIGSRFIGEINSFKSTATRRVGIKILSGLIKICTGTQISDPTSGFRGANKRVIRILASNYQTEYPEPESIVRLLKLGIKTKEIPVEMQEREFGESSIKPLKSIYYMLSVCFSIIIAALNKESEK